jgi:hypothetical protein
VIRLRASVKMYLTLTTLLIVVYLVVTAMARGKTWLVGTAIAMAVALALTLVHVWRLEVRVTADALVHRTLFRTRSMRLAEISESLVHWDQVSGEPEPLLVVVPIGSPAARMVVNLRPFRPSEVRSLLAIPALKVRLPTPR